MSGGILMEGPEARKSFFNAVFLEVFGGVFAGILSVNFSFI